MVADAMPVMVWLSDARAHNVYCNHAYLAFRGTSLEEEQKTGWFDAIHPDDREGYAAAAGSAFSQQQPFELEARFKAASGEYRWVLCRARPVADAEGRFAGYLGTSTDISQRKASEEA